MFSIDKRILNFLVIIFLTNITFLWTFFIFHKPFDFTIVFIVILVRILASILIKKDFSLSWSKASAKTFLIKSYVYIIAFLVYMILFYTKIEIYFMASELFLYLFSINFMMYFYHYVVNKSSIEKVKSVVIYGTDKVGLRIMSEFADSQYMVKYFIDDDEKIQHQSIDSIDVISKEKLQQKEVMFDLLVVAVLSASKEDIKKIYNDLQYHFKEIKIVPTLDDIYENMQLITQLKNLSVEDLLARYPKDLDKDKISSFIKDKIVLVTGAGGSIGSEICRVCERYGAKKLILLDHSEYNLYMINEEIKNVESVLAMKSVVHKDSIYQIFKEHKPHIVIHAAAYKHVPLVESNIQDSIINNVIGTKNIIDLSVEFGVEKVVMISTDKAVRPTNVMGATKRICELYAQNVKSLNSLDMVTDIVAVRFGNVLGSSGSVIPKFKSQIQNGENLTVTHPEITRYFMLIPEACELVLQAGAIGGNGEIFILDMGEPVKILDLAKKMIELSSRDDIDIEFIGLRAGEKLYEELLIHESDKTTQYDSITVAKPTIYDIDKLNQDIKELVLSKDKLIKLKEIVPEFNHQQL